MKLGIIKERPTQRALDWRVRAAFSSAFLAQANSVKMAFPRPSRQQVTHTVGQQKDNDKMNMIDFSKPSPLSRSIWQRLLAWVVTSSLVNPFAIFMGAVAGFVVVHPNLEPFIGQPPSKPLITLLLQALADSTVAGSLIGISQWLILRQFVKIRFWIPATIIGLAFGTAFFAHSIDRGWIYTPGWGNFWLIVPAISVAIPQAFLIYREGFKPIWWLLIGAASIATSFFISGTGSAFDSVLEQCARAIAFASLGAPFSAIALLMTFRRELAHPQSGNAVTT